MNVTPGQPPVARGRWTDIYDLGGGRILKRYRDTTAEPIAAFEAAVLFHARAHGVPVPKVFEVNGGDLVLERIEGPTMLRDLTRRPTPCLATLARWPNCTASSTPSPPSGGYSVRSGPVMLSSTLISTPTT